METSHAYGICTEIILTEDLVEDNYCLLMCVHSHSLTVFLKVPFARYVAMNKIDKIKDIILPRYIGEITQL